MAGDSITDAGFQKDGWCDRLQKYYKQEYDLYNGGKAGYTTRGLKSIIEAEMDRVILEDRILLTVIMMGTNDAAFYSGVDLEEYADNLSYLVDVALERSDKVLVLTPTPVVNLNDRNFTTTIRYRNKALQLFKYSDTVDIYDTWPIFLGNTTNYNKNVLYHYFGDGIHFSPAGHERFFQYVVRKLDLELGKLDFNIFNLVAFVLFVSISFIGVSVLLIKYHFTKPNPADYESIPDSVPETAE
ncbi:isoamyl acetate-hydrolyzing esterase [Boothiomyces sp. JEL0838]|nr:isoamyl acetate-hydrolyzing esterase [Boothiomyces sp. JEL0838]